MARDINEIQTEILEAKAAASELNALEMLTTTEQAEATSSSKVAVWRRWVWIIAFVQWVQEKLWDKFKAEVEQRIKEAQLHTREWYRQKALAFQYGFDLVAETDTFDNTGATDEEIAASKVVKQAAIVKRGNSVLRCKVATITIGDLAPVDNAVLTAMDAYFAQVADAGTRVITTSDTPDDFKAVFTVYYDSLIFNDLGERLDGSNDTPAQDGVNEFLKAITFNGTLVLNELREYMETLEGIVTFEIDQAASKYGLYAYTDVIASVPNVGPITHKRTAEAGYMRMDEANSTFNFVANE